VPVRKLRRAAGERFMANPNDLNAAQEVLCRWPLSSGLASQVDTVVLKAASTMESGEEATRAAHLARLVHCRAAAHWAAPRLAGSPGTGSQSPLVLSMLHRLVVQAVSAAAVRRDGSRTAAQLHALAAAAAGEGSSLSSHAAEGAPYPLLHDVIATLQGHEESVVRAETGGAAPSSARASWILGVAQGQAARGISVSESERRRRLRAAMAAAANATPADATALLALAALLLSQRAVAEAGVVLAAVLRVFAANGGASDAALGTADGIYNEPLAAALTAQVLAVSGAETLAHSLASDAVDALEASLAAYNGTDAGVGSAPAAAFIARAAAALRFSAGAPSRALSMLALESTLAPSSADSLVLSLWAGGTVAASAAASAASSTASDKAGRGGADDGPMDDSASSKSGKSSKSAVPSTSTVQSSATAHASPATPGSPSTLLPPGTVSRLAAASAAAGTVPSSPATPRRTSLAPSMSLPDDASDTSATATVRSGTSGGKSQAREAKGDRAANGLAVGGSSSHGVFAAVDVAASIDATPALTAALARQVSSLSRGSLCLTRSSLLLDLARLYLALGKTDAADAAVREAEAAVGPTAAVLTAEGLVAEARGGDDAQRLAEEAYRRALAIDANFAPALAAYGRLISAATPGSADSIATSCLERALRLRPDDATLWHSLGTLLAANGEYDRAAEALAASVDLGTTEPPFPFSEVPLVV